jgi:arginine deiminase
MELFKRIFEKEGVSGWKEYIEHDPETLASFLIEGIPLERNCLTKFLSSDSFHLRPLHNLFYTRDAAMGFNNHVFIGKMANLVRDRETTIAEAIFRNHPLLISNTINASSELAEPNEKVTIEGGDFLVARNDIIIIGLGARTSSQGIDFVLKSLKKQKSSHQHIIVQELPVFPESFIHLDMVFTLLDRNFCMAFEPVIFSLGKYRTIHIEVDNGKVASICEKPNILHVLKSLGMDVEPVFCGGNKAAIWAHEREQWHSGANFFAFAPGKIMGYERNTNTLDALAAKGFEIIKAKDVLNGKEDPEKITRCVITIPGSELARGGGGVRCMTLPVRRTEVNW